MRKNIKQLAMIVLAVFIIVSLPAYGFAADTNDNNGHWGTPAIEKCAEYGIMFGENGDMRPDDNIKVSELCAMINRTFGFTGISGTAANFTDIPKNAWYANDISAAVAVGYFQGIGDNMAGADTSISRERAFTLVARANKLAGNSEKATNFSDDSLIAPWARGALSGLADDGFIAGADGKINPKGTLTRAETAQILSNVFGTIMDENGTAASSEQLVVRRAGVSVENGVVSGNLSVTEGAAKGETNLKNVSVGGRLLLSGGNVNINRGSVKDIVVDGRAGNINVVISGGASIERLAINSQATVSFEPLIISYSNNGTLSLSGNANSCVQNSDGTVTVTVNNTTFKIVPAVNGEVVDDTTVPGGNGGSGGDGGPTGGSEVLATPANLAFNSATGTLTWDAVPNADSYFVTFGSDPAVEVTTNSYTKTGFVPGNYTATVKAHSNDAGFEDSNVATLNILAKLNLGAIQNAAITNGVLTFDALANATGYVATVNGTDHAIAAAGPLQLDIRTLSLPVGSYSITLYATGDSSYNDSATVTIPYSVIQLAAPALTYNPATDALSWNSITNADRYYVTIGTNATVTVTGAISYSLSTYAPGTYTMTVVASNSTNSDFRNSSAGTLSNVTVPKRNLGALQNCKITSGKFTWDALTNAPSYQIVIKDSGNDPVGSPYNYATTDTRSLDIYALDLPLGDYTINIKAVGNSNYNDSATVSVSYSEKVIRDLATRANFHFSNTYAADTTKYWMQDFVDFSLREGMTFDMPTTLVPNDINAAYLALLTSAPGSAQNDAAAAVIGNDVIVSFFYNNGTTDIPLTTTTGLYLIKNKIWEGWLWESDDGDPYAVISGTVPTTTIGGVVTAGKNLRVSSNIARAATAPVDPITSYDLDLVEDGVLYTQVDVIYKTGATVKVYREKVALDVPAY